MVTRNSPDAYYLGSHGPRARPTSSPAGSPSTSASRCGSIPCERARRPSTRSPRAARISRRRAFRPASNFRPARSSGRDITAFANTSSTGAAGPAPLDSRGGAGADRGRRRQPPPEDARGPAAHAAGPRVGRTGGHRYGRDHGGRFARHRAIHPRQLDRVRAQSRSASGALGGAGPLAGARHFLGHRDPGPRRQPARTASMRSSAPLAPKG